MALPLPTSRCLRRGPGGLRTAKRGGRPVLEMWVLTGQGHVVRTQQGYSIFRCPPKGAPPAGVTFSHARESNQRARIGGAPPMYPPLRESSVRCVCCGVPARAVFGAGASSCAAAGVWVLSVGALNRLRLSAGPSGSGLLFLFVVLEKLLHKLFVYGV